MKKLRRVSFTPCLVLALTIISGCSSGPEITTNTLPVDRAPPSIPQLLQGTAQSPTQIGLTWLAATDSGTGVAGYRIFRDGVAMPAATVTGTSFMDTGLAANTAYAYTVLAFDAATPANESAPSSGVVVTTQILVVPDTTPPTVPQNLTATAQSTSEIALTWQAATDAGSGVAGYRVYRDAGATLVATVVSTTYTDTGLAANTQYSYTVLAFDAAVPANASAISASASTTTNAVVPVSGLDARPANTTCLAGDAPSTSTSIDIQRAYPNLTFAGVPLVMLQAPSSTARWYVAQKNGVVVAFDDQENIATSNVFIDVSTQIATSPQPAIELGLVGMAFHPNFPTNPRVYLAYTAMLGLNLVVKVVEYQTRDGGQTLDATSPVPILTVQKPEDTHHGGNIAFGPDGFLYIGLGDGGGGGDQHGAFGNGQRLSTLLGKMLRIDVNGSTGVNRYVIPADNPYVGTALCNNDTGVFTQNCPEIYAYGFRNPWRWSFDRISDELWLGDVGQETWEEVDHVVKGGNYGWRCREGAHPYRENNCGPNLATVIDPVAEFNHTDGVAVVGGFVYRGNRIPALNGRFVFGDFGGGRIWHIARDTPPTMIMTTGFESNLMIASFAQDSDGEIYVLAYSGGIYRLIPAANGGREFPTLLSATGCVDPSDPKIPASGLIPYAPNAQFWSDGASKDHFLALPDGLQINVNAENDFVFPVGSVLVKNFSLGTQLVETRLFVHHNNGDWAGYTYEWNAQATEATRVVGGKSVSVAGQIWHFPSEAQCTQCHTAAAGRTLGLEISQLNNQFHYAQTNRDANQLFTLNAISLLSPALSQPVDQLPVMPDPFGAVGTIAERARAYLHTNCSQCHRPGGGTPAGMDFRYTTPLASSNACEVNPQSGDLGITNAKIIAVGSTAAARSIVVARANRADGSAMPPILPRMVDSAGVALLTNWINGLTSCN